MKRNMIKTAGLFLTLLLIINGVFIFTGCEDTITQVIEEEVRLAELTEYTLTILDPAAGSVTPSGITTVKEGEMYEVSASAPSGYTFAYWKIVSGNENITIVDNEASVTNVSLSGGDAIIQPVISDSVYSLTITNDTHGSTSPSGSVNVIEGEERSINASPNIGYGFTKWIVTSGTASFTNENNSSTTVTVTGGDSTIEATFTIIEHTLTLESDSQGSVTSPASPATVVDGISQNIIASNPNTRGYYFTGWTQTNGAGTASFGNPAIQYTTVTVTGGDVTIKANYSEIIVSLNYIENLDLNSVTNPLTTINDILYDNGYIYAVGEYHYSSSYKKRARILKIDVSNSSNPSYSDYLDIVDYSSTSDSTAHEIVKESSNLYVGVSGYNHDEYQSLISTDYSLNSFSYRYFGTDTDNISEGDWIAAGDDVYIYYNSNPYQYSSDDPLADILRIGDFLYVTLQAGMSSNGRLSVLEDNSGTIEEVGSSYVDGDVSIGNMAYNGDNYVYIVSTPDSGNSGILTSFVEDESFYKVGNIAGTANTGDIEFLDVGDNRNYLYAIGEGSGYDRISIFDVHGNNGSYDSPDYLYSQNTSFYGSDIRSLEIAGDYLYSIEGTRLVIYEIIKNTD